MSDVYFKASLQNTLNPEVGTFDNEKNKKGTFTLEDGEYYLTNNTSSSYRVYYPTKNINSVSFIIEFDVNYNNKGNFGWCLAFNGRESKYWHGLGVDGTTLQYRGQELPNYDIVTSPSTWLHVKCIFNYLLNQNTVHIYIDNVEVNKFIISNNYDIKYIEILGNSGGFVPDAKIKNIIIYDSSEKHYLDTSGLISLWSKIRSLFVATKTELASKANTSDLNNYYTKKQINIMLESGSGGGGSSTGGGSSSVITSDITIYDLVPDGAEAHNAMWGGRDITAAFDAGTVSANIANGTFRDIFPGDYITKQVTISGTAYTVNWVIADCDYWWHKGDQNNGMETHHVVIVPQQPIFSANMNVTNTTEGGYAGSRMYTETIPACATGIVNAFGSDHILTFRDQLTRFLNTSAVPSGITVLTGASYWDGAWYSQQCNLMSEAMVYDGPHCASSALDNIMATRQMSAFRLSERLINYNRQWWWLRDVVSSAGFAGVSSSGYADTDNASYSHGVRPFALLR